MDGAWTEKPTQLWTADVATEGRGITTCAYPGCRARLSPIERGTGGGKRYGWRHGPTPPGVDEHEPEPVHMDEHKADLVCDFCSGPGPRWLLGCENFQHVDVRLGDDGDRVEVTSNTGWAWACCVPCKVLLDVGDVEATVHRWWNRYADRYLVGVSRMERRAVERVQWPKVRAFHMSFLQHRTGVDEVMED